MAIPDVVIRFIAAGIPDITRAFKSVQQTIAQGENINTRATQSGAQARIRSVNTEAREKIRAYQVADRAQDQAIKAGVRAAEQAGKAETRAEQQTARQKQAIRERSASMAGALASKQAADEARAYERGERQKQAIRERSASMAGAFAAKQAKAEAHARDVADRQAQHNGEQFANTLMGAGRNAGRTISGGIQKVGGTLLTLGGGFSVADSIQDMASLEKTSVRFSNAAFMGRPGEKRIDPKELENQAKVASIATGIDANDLAKGAHAFLAKTGNGAEALANMKMFGDIAQGTGADINDVANAAGTLRVQNEDLTPEKMKSLLLQTVRQGQKGSVEFSDLAGSVGKITRTAANYAGPQEENQAKLLGLAQLGMRTMSDPRAIATSLAAIDTQANKHSKQMEAVLGPGMFNEKGQIAKGPDEFIASVMEKTGGDIRNLQKMGFSGKSLEYFQALTPEFQKAGGGKAGADKIREDMKDIIASPMGEDELQQNVKNVLNTSAMQFEMSTRALKVAVGEQLLPEFVKLVPVLKDLIPYLTRFLQGVISLAEWASSNPFSGLALTISTLIGKEIIAAKIADTIKSLITGGGGAGVPGVGGAGAGASGGGAGLAAGGLITLGTAAEIGGASHYADEAYGAYKRGNDRGADLAKLASTGTPQQQAAAAQEVHEARSRSGTGDVAMSYVDYATRIGGALVNPTGTVGSIAASYGSEALGGKGATAISSETIEAAATAKKFDELTNATSKLSAAMLSAADNTNASTSASARGQPIPTRVNGK